MVVTPRRLTKRYCLRIVAKIQQVTVHPEVLEGFFNLTKGFQRSGEIVPSCQIVGVPGEHCTELSGD